MPIDTSIQFNGHNSYRVTETVFCEPFGVQGMAYVTHSFNAFAASALGAATRARTRFFSASGTIVGTTDHSFAVGVVFTEVDLTVAVPATAVLCQLSFITSGTWWVAEPKSEEGQTATPYNTNYQGQLSMITPDGAYLGMLATSQIVVAGTLADPTESLSTRLVTINNNQINLSSTSAAHGTRLTNIEAGQIILSGSTTGSLPAACIGNGAIEVAKLGTTVIVGGYFKTDLIATKAITGAQLADGTVGDLQIKSGLSASKITADKLQSVDGKTYFDLTNSEIKETTTIDGKAITVIISPTKPFELIIDGHKEMYISGAGVLVPNRFDINEDGYVDQEDLNLVLSHIMTGSPTLAEYPRMDINGDGHVNAIELTMIYRAMSIPARMSDIVSGNEAGIDATGFYKTVGGVKTYL